MKSKIEYNEVKECIYKNELYSVRDDGAVMRHKREDKSKRKLDDLWTYGIPDDKGYMVICGEKVHRIVATAFHGPAPSTQHVVDHIDTNRKNNRPDNLRWLTKLENILNNDITRKKVELICGSIEAFLEQPSLLYGHESDDKNFSWMHKVTPEEARISLENWTHWAKTASPNPNYKKKEEHDLDRIFKSQTNSTPIFSDLPPITIPGINTPIDANESHEIIQEKEGAIDWYDSLTPSAKQSWRTPTEFPCCPSGVIDDGLELYKERLYAGNLFSKNAYDSYYVIDCCVVKDKDMLVILSTNKEGDGVLGSYSLSSVKIDDGKYAHISIQRFGDKEYATHFYKIAIGEEKMTEEDYENLDCI